MSPSSHRRTNTSRTAAEYFSSSVKSRRDQSHELPITLSCSIIVFPVFFTNSHTQRSIFFFKQKTAYEIGLGIPAEPLFRSKSHTADSAFADELSQPQH